MAVDALGNMGDIRSTDPLIRLLEDNDHNVRFATVHALGAMGHPSASKALTHTCETDNCFVKIAAEEALLKPGESEKSNHTQKAGAPLSAFTQ